jgi:hypothetical protein
MTAIYDIDNDDNWVQIYNGSFAATYPQGQQIRVYTPIPRTVLPVDIDSSLVAVYCTSTDYPDSPKILGRIVQAVTGNSIFPTTGVYSKGKSIYSNETILAEFLEYDDSYRLQLIPRFYVEQLDVTIFKYIGVANFSIENRLDLIEEKIDRLL